MTFIFLIFTFKSLGSFLRAGAKAPTLWLSGGNRRVMCNAGICRHYILFYKYRFSFFRIPWWVCPHRSRHIFGESAVSTDPGNLVSVSSFLLSVFLLFFYFTMILFFFPHPRLLFLFPTQGSCFFSPPKALQWRAVEHP